jgi:hypothetical protein
MSPCHVCKTNPGDWGIKQVFHSIAGKIIRIEKKDILTLKAIE